MKKTGTDHLYLLAINSIFQILYIESLILELNIPRLQFSYIMNDLLCNFNHLWKIKLSLKSKIHITYKLSKKMKQVFSLHLAIRTITLLIATNSND